MKLFQDLRKFLTPHPEPPTPSIIDYDFKKVNAGPRLLYEDWIKQIVMDIQSIPNILVPREDLIQHLHKHIDELATEGPSDTWIASMTSLLEITRQVFRMDYPTYEIMLSRLYQHWIDDPKNSTPPPFPSLTWLDSTTQ